MRDIGRKHIEKVIAAIKNEEEVADSILACIIKDNGEQMYVWIFWKQVLKELMLA